MNVCARMYTCLSTFVYVYYTYAYICMCLWCTCICVSVYVYVWASIYPCILYYIILCQTCRTLLEKQGRIHKRCTLMDPHTWPWKSRTTSSYVRIRDVVLKTYLGRWTIGKSGERGPGISVLPARYDDDDDDIIL